MMGLEFPVENTVSQMIYIIEKSVFFSDFETRILVSKGHRTILGISLVGRGPVLIQDPGLWGRKVCRLLI